jgi:hypothetical protein
VRQPLTALRALGHWTSWGSGVDRETYGRARVLVSQFINLEPSVATWEKRCAEGDRLCVFDLDDDVWMVHENPAHGPAFDDPETIPRIERVIQAAHLVTVATPRLAALIRKLNPAVTVLRNCVADFAVDLTPYLAGSTLRIGYTGSPSHVDDFTAWSVVLDRWMRKYAHRTRLELFGAPGRPVGAPLTYRIGVHPWQKDVPAYLRGMEGKFNVGIAMLDRVPFNMAKSGIKAQEYAALGVPCVATDMQQYRDVIRHGETGFLARTDRDWLSAFELLMDPDRRRTMGENARQLAREEFLQGPRAVQWEAAYQRAAARIGVRL